MNSSNIIDIVPEKWNTEQDTEQTEKPKKPFELFGIIDALFVDKEKIYSLSDETCKQYLFMVLRRLAIKYPLQANHFNDGKSNPKDVIRFWADYLYTGSYVPKWTKTSGTTKSSKNKANKEDFTKDEIKLYRKHYDITEKEYDDMMRFFTEDTIEEIKAFKKYLKQKSTKE